MATKTTTKSRESSGSILSGLMEKVGKNERETLENLDNKRLRLQDEERNALRSYESTIDDIVEGKAKNATESLSKLDQSISEGLVYKKEVSEISESLTNDLTEFGNLINNMTNFHTVEKLVSFFHTKSAEKMRMKRVRNADIHDSLYTILDYATLMTQRLNDYAIQLVECHTKIDSTIDKTVETLEVNQPIYQEKRQKREELERQISLTRDKLDKANEVDYPSINKELTKLERNFQEIKIDENHYFIRANEAKNAIPTQKIHLKAYSDGIEAVTMMRTKVHDKIEHVTTLYESAPVMIRTSLGMKAASKTDQGINAATNLTTKQVLSSVAGILDETAYRMEKELIDPETREAYRKLQVQMDAEFDSRINSVKTMHSSSKR